MKETNEMFRWEEPEFDPGGMRPARIPKGTKVTHAETGISILVPPSCTMSRWVQHRICAAAMASALEALAGNK